MAIGAIARPHGLAGELAVDLLTDFPERFRAGLAVVLRAPSGEERPAAIVAARPHAGRMLVRIEGVDDADAAGQLRGWDVCVPAASVERPEGYVFHYEVEGCAVVDRDGRPLGTARELEAGAAQPLLVVETPRGRREVPFVAPIVVAIDLAARRITVSPPPGLLD